MSHPPSHLQPRTFGLLAAAVVLLAVSVPAAAQYGSSTSYDCTESRKNMQCNEFGTIKMDSQVKIAGQPATVTTTVTLNTNYEERGARWVLFSVRNVTNEASEPISVNVESISTPNGPLVTTEVRRGGPNEVNIWVHVMDVPANTPIEITSSVGAADRGAYALETLIMPFDRGYAPIKDMSGTDVSLFSFTLLSVQEVTEKVDTSSDGGGGKLGQKVPGPAIALVMVAALVAVAVRRRLA